MRGPEQRSWISCGWLPLTLWGFPPVPDAESYLWQLQNNFIRMTDQECHLPEAGLEKQAQVMFAALAKVGALEVLEDG